MKIKGFIAILLMAGIIVFFIYILKPGKKEAIEKGIEGISQAKIGVTKINMKALESDIISFIASRGEAPDNLNQLMKRNPLGAEKWDEWGMEIKYEKISDLNYRLISAGKDRQFNTQDDIVIEN